MKFQSQFDHEKHKGFITKGKSRTDQSFAKDADVNTLMSKYLKTGTLPNAQNDYLYQDTTLLPSFHECQNFLVETNQKFGLLDPKIRSRFHNDPQEMIDFLNDPDNDNEAIKLGLRQNPLKPKSLEQPGNKDNSTPEPVEEPQTPPPQENP